MHYTTTGSSFADPICRCDIPPFPPSVAPRPKFVDFLVAGSALRAAVSKGAKLFAVIVFHNGEYFVESGQKFQNRWNVALPEFALIDSNIRFADQVEYGRKGTRRIQVI